MIGSSLTTVVAFRLIGSRERYRKRGLHTQVDEKKRLVKAGSCHKGRAQKVYHVSMKLLIHLTMKCRASERENIN